MSTDRSPQFPSPDPTLDAAVLAARASSFGARAALYADARPDYPVPAVRWALAPLGDRGLRVLDLGAGTGKLTQVLLRALPAGSDIVAVEPDPRMRAELRALLPSVRAESGSAEAIPLPDHAVDAILVGQAMHWFDLSRALPEMARVLAPGGVLAGLWNLDDDQVPWVRELKATAHSLVSWSNWQPDRLALDSGGHFDTPERADFPHRQRHTVESLIATTSTHSHVLVLDEPQRRQVLDDVRAYLLATPETADGEFILPLITVVLRARAR
jgi:SAM-dependent methyltransferase